MISVNYKIPCLTVKQMPQLFSHNSINEHYYELAKVYFHTVHFFKICYNFVPPFYTLVGRDSSVGIAIGYGLDGPEIESRYS
jgi:hypothetical protein